MSFVHGGRFSSSVSRLSSSSYSSEKRDGSVSSARLRLDKLMRRARLYKTKAGGSRAVRGPRGNRSASYLNSPIIIEQPSHKSSYRGSAMQSMELMPSVSSVAGKSVELYAPPKENREFGVQAEESVAKDERLEQRYSLTDCSNDREFIQFLKTISLFCQQDDPELPEEYSEHARLYRNLMYLREAFKKYKEITSGRKKDTYRKEDARGPKERSMLRPESKEDAVVYDKDRKRDDRRATALMSTYEIEEGLDALCSNKVSLTRGDPYDNEGESLDEPATSFGHVPPRLVHSGQRDSERLSTDKRSVKTYKKSSDRTNGTSISYINDMYEKLFSQQ